MLGQLGSLWQSWHRMGPWGRGRQTVPSVGASGLGSVPSAPAAPARGEVRGGVSQHVGLGRGGGPAALPNGRLQLLGPWGGHCWLGLGLMSPEQGGLGRVAAPGSAPGPPPHRPPPPWRISWDNPVLTWPRAGTGMVDAQPWGCPQCCLHRPPALARGTHPRGSSTVPTQHPRGGRWGEPPAPGS